MENQTKTYDELLEENAELKQRIAVLEKAVFGPKSEKTKKEEISEQLTFDEAEEKQSVNEREDEKQTVVTGYSRKKKRTRDEIFANLPVEEVVHPVEDKICPECGNEMEVIGKEYIREELVYVPAKIFRRKHYSEVVKCSVCGTDESKDTVSETSTKSVIVKADVPNPVLPKSYSSPELLAHILYEKYAKGVPLERQAKDFKNLGADISTATLANWVIESTKVYLKPIYDYLHEELLKEEVIHADETVVQVLKEKNRKATTQSRMWVYCTDKIKLYDYRPTRSGQNAVEFLEGYNGYLVCDGYDGYNKLKAVRRCGCWAHARRKFLEAIPTDPEAAKTSKAKEGYERINEIFALESSLKELAPKEKQKQRLEQIKPVLDGFYSWLETLMISGNTKLAKAIQYALNEKRYLYEFLSNPNIPIDNNMAERAVKPFVIGRKNWLFSTSVKGANASAIAYSVINTADANGLNIREYLTSVFNNPGELILPINSKSKAK